MPILHRAIGVTDTGKTPLMDAVVKGDIDSIDALIAEGVDVNDQDEYGWTALQLAAAYGRDEIVDTLLGKDADPNIEEQHWPHSTNVRGSPWPYVNSESLIRCPRGC